MMRTRRRKKWRRKKEEKIKKEGKKLKDEDESEEEAGRFLGYRSFLRLGEAVNILVFSTSYSGIPQS